MPSRIRVVEIIHGFGIEGGGAGSYAIELSRGLDKTRFEVCVCGLWEHNRKDEKDRIKGLNDEGTGAFAASTWDPGRPYRSFNASLRAIKTHLKDFRPHILHSHSEFGDAAALFLKPFQKTALVRTVHNGHLVEWRKRPLRRLFLSNLLVPLLYEVEIGVSPHIAAQLNQRPLACWLNKSAVQINNAIDLRKFQEESASPGEMKRSLGFPEKSVVIGSLGRLAEEKGYRDLIQAASTIAREFPEVIFLVVGDGPQKEELKELTTSLGIEKQVVLTGYRTDIVDILGCIDLYVSASLWEGLPTSILESMAAGIPVVCTAIPGSLEIVKPGENGWIAHPGSPESLASAIREALARPDLRQAYTRRSMELVSGYSIDAAARKHMDLYEKIWGKMGAV
jgi:glycosyltransferase involved in cell wall biosynthesis